MCYSLDLIFDSSLIPSVWRKSVICICLFFTDSSSDPRIPTDYRGINLLACLSKLYTSFMNKQLIKFLENDNILADEQNGYRPDRSCQDHIFTLNSVKRNNSQVFTSSIDLRKCFDFIDRDMMLYNILLHKVDGKMYNSIKTIYQHTSSCVRIKGNTPNGSTVNRGWNKGITSILLCAGDIILIFSSAQYLQQMLKVLHNWCKNREFFKIQTNQNVSISAKAVWHSLIACFYLVWIP
jgi:hypothetical protein